MRRTAKVLALTLLLLILDLELPITLTMSVWASRPPQQRRAVEPANQTATTVTGGTGLFATWSGRTLRRTEFTLGFSWNNFDRDPGDVDINQIPVSFTYGVTSRVELFANVAFFQQVTARQPFALSGYQFNGVRSAFGGDPFVAFGPPVGGREGAAAFFPLSGSPLGGVLPPPGAAFGPAILADRPSFLNDLPFFGPATFDVLTRNFQIRQSANGLGDITVGTKIALTDPDGIFNLALLGFVRLPSARNFHALSQGRGAGATDYGIVLINGQNFLGNRLRLVQNYGYVRSGDIERNGIKLLDRRDQLLLNAGVEIAPVQSLVLTAEWANTFYIGGGTPRFNAVNPSELILGARLYAYEGRIQLGGAWRRLLNQADQKTIPVFVPGQGIRQLDISSGDVNGFVFNFALARRASLIPLPPPNRAPVVSLLAERTELREGEAVRLEARAVDPDNDPLSLAWSVEPATVPATVLKPEIAGAPLSERVIFDATGVNPTPGAPPVTVTVTVTVDDGRGGTATDRRTLSVASPVAAAPPPPPPPPPPPANRPPQIQMIEITPIGAPQVPGQITDGDLLRLRAVVADPDGDVLIYRWGSTAGRRLGTGSEITLDTTGVTAGPGAPPVTITITLTVDDGRGGTDSDTRSIAVLSVARPQALAETPLIFVRLNAARVTNVHKAILDIVAERLKADPRAQLVIDGHQDAAERPTLARTRAQNAALYLVRERAIDRRRIILRDFGSRRPHPSGRRAMNRRVEMWIVPPGAEMPPDSAAAPIPFEPTAPPAPRRRAPTRQPTASSERRPTSQQKLHLPVTARPTPTTSAQALTRQSQKRQQQKPRQRPPSSR